MKNSINEFSNKNDLFLFKFSNLKSRINLSLSQNNSFCYDLSKIEVNESKNARKETLNERNISRYIKKVNIDIPSSKKLLIKRYRDEFLQSYDDSFSYFCGISKDQFIKVYINQQYKPTLSEFGNITLSINSILQVLNSFSDSKKLKITRRLRRKRRMKKNIKYKNKNTALDKSRIFNITKEKKAKSSKNENLYDKLNYRENASPILNIKNDSENQKGNKKEKTLISIKKVLKNISIPDAGFGTISSKEKSLESSSSEDIPDKENINSNINNNLLLDNNCINLSKYNKIASNIENRPFVGFKNIKSNQTLSNNLDSGNNNNIFNFPSNTIQNYTNNFQNKNEKENEIVRGQPATLFNKNNNNNDVNMNFNNNLNDNNKTILSPLNISLDYDNILSPNIHFPKNEITSPFLPNISPFNVNDINQYFVFNNSPVDNSFLFENNNNEKYNYAEFINNNKNNSNDHDNNNKEELINLNEQKINNNNKNEKAKK